MVSLVPKNIFEGIEFSEANTVLLMSLMDETQEDDFFGDDRLVSMIQSLEAEINDPPIDQRAETGHVDGQDCSTSVGNDFSWADLELASSSAFDEMIPWSPCGDQEMESIALMEYGVGNNDYSQICYEVLLEQ